VQVAGDSAILPHEAEGMEGLEMGGFLGMAELVQRPVPFANKQVYGSEDVLLRHQNV
jgi:hypothetical protein